MAVNTTLNFSYYLSIANLNSTDEIEAYHYYILSLDYQKEIIHAFSDLIQPIYNHVVNNHKPLLKSQAEELAQLATSIESFMKLAIDSLENNNNQQLEKLQAEQEYIITLIKEARKNLIKSIKKNDIGNKASMLYLGILIETRNILIFTSNLLKIQNDFAQSLKNKSDFNNY